MEDPTSKGDESSKKVPATSSSSSGRRGKEVTVNTVNTAQQVPQQYSMNYTATPPTAPSYAPQAPQYRPQASTQPIYYSAPPPPPPSTAPSPVVHHYAPTPSQAPQYQPPIPRTSQPTQRVPPPQSQLGGAAQPRPRRQYPALPVPLSHIYRQIRDKIGTIAPGPSFDPTIQDQSKQCEYHRGAPGHTLDTCWRLRERIQEMIDAKEVVFNAVRPPNVQANPLPDHGSAPEPSINMITLCTSGKGEGEQGCSSPFVIEHIPAEAAVGFTGIDAPPAPLVIDILDREPYSDDKVPWTYEKGVGSLEQQFSVMGVSRSGRLYKNPATTDKGKAPDTEEETRPRTLHTPSKKDTPPTPIHSQTPLTQVTSPVMPTDISTAHSGILIGHPPPTAQTASNLVESARFTALEGMVNHLAANMATNMTELMAILRNQNQASSSFTLPLEHRPIVDPNPTVTPTFVSEVEDASFSAMAFAPTVHPINDPLPPPPAPTAIPLPPAAFLSTDSTMHTLPPLTVSMHPPIYTVPPPTVPPVTIA
ncbi:extensin-like [Punica granatum]|uniref:Extensin-like n=1 Tax=Punica granatum TaxID=22663 RepID=A0A6P8BUX5_PUNGR|nr:extensin-like [Punica granatum]